MKKNGIISGIAFAVIACLTLSSCEKETLVPYSKTNNKGQINLNGSEKSKTYSDTHTSTIIGNELDVIEETKIKTHMEEPVRNNELVTLINMKPKPDIKPLVIMPQTRDAANYKPSTQHN